MDVTRLHTALAGLLALDHPPIGIAFRETAPPGIARVAHAGPAGCAYWRLAGDGQAFYTEPADHYNCPVGAHTHGIALPAERAHELPGIVGTMVDLQYIKMEEVPELPRRTEAFRVAIYAPLASSPVDPDVVIVRGNARQIMLLAEATGAAGIARDGAVMGRPACAMIPEAIRSARATPSLGCIGNRVYTGLGDDELYLAIPGARLPEVVSQLETIVEANRQLEQYHQARRATL